MNSFIPWIGGKSQSRYIILPRFPPFYGRYIEVFGGGGWILFAKEPEPFEVYNDFNNNLYNLFCCVKYRPAAFLKQLGYLPVNARREFDVLLKHINGEDIATAFINEETALMQEFELPNFSELIGLLYGENNGAKHCDVRRAADFYKVIRYSYASGCTSFSCQPSNIKSAFQQIISANKRLNDNGCILGNKAYKRPNDAGNGVILENKDFESLIRQYDRPESFFYCDPPYYQTEGCYAVAFKKEDHYRLKEVLSGIQGKFMLSYNDCEFIRELYDSYHMKSYSRINSISQRYDAGGLYGELLIANYDMEERMQSKPAQITLF
jgi:DNA adenine methylase